MQLSNILLLLLGAAMIVATGCQDNATQPEAPGQAGGIRMTRPHSLDDECNESFDVNTYDVEVKDEASARILGVFTYEASEAEGGFAPININVPADALVRITMTGSLSGTPMLLGETVRTFSAEDNPPIVIHLVPHPDWPGSAVTLVNLGLSQEDNGSYAVGIHTHIPRAHDAIWAVLCWNSDDVLVDETSILFAENTLSVYGMDGAAMRAIPMSDPALTETFCAGTRNDRALGVLMLGNGASIPSYSGYAAAFLAEPLRGDTSSIVQLAAAGWDSGILREHCPVAFNVSASPEEISNCLTESFDGIEGYVNSIRDTSVDCRFDWDYTLGANEYRIVLTWNDTPRDLDSHLRTLGKEVFYANRNRGSLTGPPWAALDRDDTDGNGPETITIAQVLDTCKYWVYNFSGEPELTASRAVVRVYGQSGLMRTYNVPETGEGRYWYVLDIQPGGTILDRNSLQSENPGGGEGIAERIVPKE